VFSSEKIKILLVDDHKIICEGLRLLFESQPDMEVLDEVEVDKTFLQLAHEPEPDVIVIGFNRPKIDNIELSRRILNEKPNIKIVAHTAHLHKHILDQAIRIGISSFVLKECGFDELARAVRAAYENRIYMCTKTKDILSNGYLSQMREEHNPESSALTERDYEIIRLLSIGMTSKEIALRMNISPKTVDACRRQIMCKLRISNIAELIKHAIQVGLTPLEV